MFRGCHSEHARRISLTVVVFLLFSLSSHSDVVSSYRPIMGPQRPGSQLLIGKKIDLNTASAIELELLPGIGPVLASRIIEDREQNGYFSDPSSLDRVPGIGPKILEKLAPYLTTK